jgi:predicted dehydrogenase
MSFDVWETNSERITIYGSEGTLSVPDPNTFGGPVRLLKNGEWKEIKLNDYPLPGRGTGVADMARAIRTGRKHRANGDLAYHALDLMRSFADASQANRHVFLESACERPEPLALIDPKEAIRL